MLCDISDTWWTDEQLFLDASDTWPAILIQSVLEQIKKEFRFSPIIVLCNVKAKDNGHELLCTCSTTSHVPQSTMHSHFLPTPSLLLPLFNLIPEVSRSYQPQTFQI